MNDILEFIDQLNVKADKHSADLATVIESNMVMLKWKVARCAKNCFEEHTTLQTALKCEHECKASVGSVTEFIKATSDSAMKDFDVCIRRFEDVVEGRDEPANLHQGVAMCYRSLHNSLVEMEKSVLEEFSYYK